VRHFGQTSDHLDIRNGLGVPVLNPLRLRLFSAILCRMFATAAFLAARLLTARPRAVCSRLDS